MKRLILLIFVFLLWNHVAFANFIQKGDSYYYYNDDGSTYTGWKQLDRGDGYQSWHYFLSSQMCSDLRSIDGTQYYFWNGYCEDINGVIHPKGTLAWGDPYMGVYEPNGDLLTAADKEGHLFTNCEMTIDGKRYEFDRLGLADPLDGEDAWFSVVNASKPERIVQGSFFPIKGTIYSSSNITNLLAEIVSNNGTQYCGIREYPNTTFYDLGNTVDDAMRFDILSPGTYIYRVWAENKSGKSEWVIWYQFSVVSAGGGQNADTQSRVSGDFYERLRQLQNYYPNRQSMNNSNRVVDGKKIVVNGELNFDGSASCVAYGKLIGYEVFGIHWDSWDKYERYESKEYGNRPLDPNLGGLRAGDILRATTDLVHFIFVTKVEGDKIYFTDANWIHPNVVRWNQVISKQTLLDGISSANNMEYDSYRSAPASARRAVGLYD